MESRADEPPKLKSDTRLRGGVGGDVSGSVGGVALLAGVDVEEAADVERCLGCGGIALRLVLRGDMVGGDGGSGVLVGSKSSAVGNVAGCRCGNAALLIGSESSTVGDLAGFRCGIGGACAGVFTRARSCTKRETCSSWSSRVPGRSYMESKRSAMGVTTLSSRGSDALHGVSFACRLLTRCLPLYRLDEEANGLCVHL